jgi:hypothetical protein
MAAIDCEFSKQQARRAVFLSPSDSEQTRSLPLGRQMTRRVPALCQALLPENALLEVPGKLAKMVRERAPQARATRAR